MDVFAAVRFHRHDHVRLLTTYREVPEGSVGRVLGRFARPSGPSYFVVFEEHPAGVEVAADALELHDLMIMLAPAGG